MPAREFHAAKKLIIHFLLPNINLYFFPSSSSPSALAKNSLFPERCWRMGEKVAGG
jgi:hypothetical protein